MDTIAHSTSQLPVHCFQSTVTRLRKTKFTSDATEMSEQIRYITCNPILIILILCFKWRQDRRSGINGRKVILAALPLKSCVVS